MRYFEDEDLRELQTCVAAGRFWRPLMVRFNLLERCNWRCQMCQVDKISRGPLSVADWTAIARDVIALGCRELSFSGGEPTLYEGFIDLLAEIRQLDPDGRVKLKVLTNGTRLQSERIERYLEQGLTRFIVSLHGARAEIHDRIVGREGQWKRTCEGVRRLTGSRPAPTVWLASVVRNANLDDLPEMMNLTVELGCEGIGFSLMDRRVADPVDAPLTLDQMRAAQRIVLPEIRRRAADLGVGLFPIDAEVFGTTSEQTAAIAAGDFSAGYYEDHACYWPYYHLNIAPDGRVHPCCYKPLPAGYGNIHRDGATTTMASPTLAEFLGQIAYRPAAFATCRACEMKLQLNRFIHDRLVQLDLPPRPVAPRSTAT